MASQPGPEGPCRGPLANGRAVEGTIYNRPLNRTGVLHQAASDCRAPHCHRFHHHLTPPHHIALSSPHRPSAATRRYDLVVTSFTAQCASHALK